MNIHPLFVHFPIAFLILYAICELLRFKAFQSLPYWFYIKAILVIIGTAFAYIAIAAGEAAEHIVTKDKPFLKPLIEAHAGYAGASTLIFSVLAFCYLVAWLEKIFGSAFFENKTLMAITYFIIKVKNLFIETKLVLLFALAGLITMIITGALGASIVYGPDADFIVKFIYTIIIGG